jgi:hypothetical protein
MKAEGRKPRADSTLHPSPFTFFFLLAALTLAGCVQPAGKPLHWVWPGANDCNTLEFRQAGTNPRGRINYRKAWDAERFDVADFDPVPCAALADHAPLTGDFDRDGRLGIVVASLSQPPLTVLDWQGLEKSGAKPGISRAEVGLESTRVVAGAAAEFARLPDVLLRNCAGRGGPFCVSLNSRTVALSVRLERAGRGFAKVVDCHDCATGGLRWSHVFGARPDLMAVTDLDGDGRAELLFVTYGEENGVTANGTTDHDSTFCVALRDDGVRLWRRGFGAHPFSGSIACVADVNADSKPEVVVAGYTWQNDHGRLAVPPGRSSRRRRAGRGSRNPTSRSAVPTSTAMAGWR